MDLIETVLDPFEAGGEMAERCRAYNWGSTALGPVSEWSHSLRSTVSTLLASRHPMFVWWGPELVQIFNDAYRPSFGASGRHVAALGARGYEHWSDIWDIIGPQVEHVMATGEATWHEDHLVPIERNGRLENVWWTCGYSPVRDDDGSIAGVLVVVQETTARVLMLAEREAARERAELERSRLNELFRQAPAFIAVLRGPDFVFELANDNYHRLVGDREVLGKPVFDALPDVRGQGYEKLLREVLETGKAVVGREVPLTLSSSSGAEQDKRFVTFVYAPLREADGHVSGVFVHGVDVTDEVHARNEAEAARAQAESARELNARLYALSNALASASTREQVAESVVTRTAIVFDAVGVVIAQMTRDEALEIMRTGDMPDAIRSEWNRIPLDADAPLAEVARTREPIFLESRAQWVARYPHLIPLLDATGHHANAVLPLAVDNRLLGVLGIAFDAPREFSGDDRALAGAVAAQCAQALERARLYEAEHEAREEAERANRSKSEFLAVMSHELRTPLNAISGYAELLDLGIQGPVTPEQRIALGHIQTSQRHLLGLINEVLNYSRVEAGAIEYDVASVPLDEVLTMCVALVTPQARGKALDLTFDECEPTLAVRADREKLQQILLNLLSNAVKFTEPNGAVSLVCESDAQVVRIQVRDTGTGIPHDQHERIFHPFVQVDTRLTRTHQGTGLGLAISRDLARGMGGEISVVSEMGAGSTFTVTLPRA